VEGFDAPATNNTAAINLGCSRHLLDPKSVQALNR
jgi:hypothetical protein